MPLANDASGGAGPSGSTPFAELLRLQTDFQARLADETFRYLRRLHGTLGPAAPGTVARPTPGLALRAEAPPGGRAPLRVEVQNLQRVHCVVAPHLTALLGPGGVTWIPATDPPLGSQLVAPGAVETVAVTLDVPAELPAGRYRGSLLLAGFTDGAVPVEITVAARRAESDPPSDAPPAERPAPQPRKAPRRPSTRKRT
jgi:hypothetical protein